VNTLHTNTDCCSPRNSRIKKSYIGAASLISAGGAAGLVGVGCLGCIPFLGAALAASSIATVLDENLLLLQIGLIALSAFLSFFYFRKIGFSKAQTAIAYSAYIALAANAIFFEKKPIAIGLIAVLAIAHILKKKPALKLLYFKGCPTYPELQRELDSRGLSYQEIDLEHLKESDPLRRHSSPTLVFRKEILFGTTNTSASLSCSFASKDDLGTAAEKAAVLSRKSSGN
jgi:hypothetical protein